MLPPSLEGSKGIMSQDGGAQSHPSGSHWHPCCRATAPSCLPRSCQCTVKEKVGCGTSPVSCWDPSSGEVRIWGSLAADPGR